MNDVLALVAMIGLAVVVLSLPRWTSQTRLRRWVYRHVDQPLGARSWENDRRTQRRRVVGFFSHDLANLMYPSTEYGGAAALPGQRRMRRYIVDLPLPPKTWPRPWFRRNITQASFTWSPEAHSNAPGFADTVGRKFADALDRVWTPDLFDVTDHRMDRPPRRVLTYRLAKAEPVPEHLAAADELGAT